MATCNAPKTGHATQICKMWRRPSKHWRHFGAFCFSCSLGSLLFPSLVLWCVVLCSSDSSVFEPAFLCLYPFLLRLSIVCLVCTCLYTVSTPCSSPDFLLSLLCFLLLSRLPGSVAHVLQPVLPSCFWILTSSCMLQSLCIISIICIMLLPTESELLDA